MIIPKKPDIKTAHFASQTYMKSLLLSGVEVYYYTKGMMHSKVMVVDRSISTVGSTNMDQRSFSLNAEVNAFILDDGIAKQLAREFEEDLKHCYRLNRKELEIRPWYIKFISSLARLLAPLL